jgi:ribosomal protein S18 acetylase RimI-like enzyme
MRVTSKMQGRGIGRTILDALEERARQLGYAHAILLTGPDQHPAVDLYRAAGYVITAVETHGELPGVRMRNALTDPTNVT